MSEHTSLKSETFLQRQPCRNPSEIGTAALLDEAAGEAKTEKEFNVIKPHNKRPR
jgi:hypothetical protein